MFADTKKNLLTRVIALQRTKCDYDAFQMNKNSTPPPFCDCKYGEGSKFSGEENGCPELRLVAHLLSVMTDEEYKVLLSRSE